MIMYVLLAVAVYSQLMFHAATARVAMMPAATCNQFQSVCDKAKNGIDTLVGVIQFLGGAATILLVAIAGILFLISRNNPKHQDSAKSVLVWAVVGVAVLALAKPIASGITGIFGL